MGYFEVTAKCGHVGKGYFIPIHFAIFAKDRKHAANLTRRKARVKHDRPDAILEVKEITREEYKELRAQNKDDPYLNCKNIQQQRAIEGLESRIEVDEYHRSRCEKKYEKVKSTEYKLKKSEILDKQKKKELHEFYDLNGQFISQISF